jgi:hypothetical protein
MGTDGFDNYSVEALVPNACFSFPALDRRIEEAL